MPTSCDGVKRQPEDPRVETAKRRQSGFESEEKETASPCKSLVPKVGKIFDEGRPGKERREKMRLKERPIGRGEQNALQGFAVSRKNRDRIDGRPDGAAPFVKKSRVPGRFFATPNHRPAAPFNIFRPVETAGRKTSRPPPTGDEVGAERLAHGRFSCGVEFQYRHERESECRIPRIRTGRPGRCSSKRQTFESGFPQETRGFRKSIPSVHSPRHSTE